MEVFLKGFQCRRCSHQWKPRKAGTPRKCPGCDSASWQHPKPRTKPPVGNCISSDEPPPDQLIDKLIGTPVEEVAEGLRGLTWPDDKFADDLEDIQASQPMEDLMGIWKGSGHENEVDEFLTWRHSEGRRGI
jgi:hypothetical protein